MAAEFDALCGCGFSATKIATIKAIAEGALSGLIPPCNVAGTMDDHELIARVATIKGIGRWTVEMLLMYSLVRMDILPADPPRSDADFNRSVTELNMSVSSYLRSRQDGVASDAATTKLVKHVGGLFPI
jgi:hypothetical protein